MESSTAAVEGGAKCRRPADKAQLTFTQSINYLIYAFALLGFNLRPGNRKYRVICHIMFAHNMLIAALNIRALIGAPWQTQGNTHMTVRLYVGTVTIFGHIIANILHRLQAQEFAAVIQSAESILKRLGGEENPLLAKVNKWKAIYLLFPGLLLLHAYYAAMEEWLAHQRSAQSGTDQSVGQWSPEEYNYIFHLWMAPFGNVNIAIRILFYLSSAAVINLLMSQLANYNPNSDTSTRSDATKVGNSLNGVLKFVSIHRDLCQLLHSMDKAFAPISLANYGLLVIVLLFLLRVTFVSEEWMKGTLIVLMIVGTLTFSILAILMTGFHNNWKLCLSRLLEMGLRLEAEGQLTHRKAFALSAKLELYVTYVQLDEPGWSLGGLIKMEPHTIVAICGILLTYTVYLYGK